MDSCLQRLQDAITHAVQGMSADDLAWHPEGKWCAAEVLEHLYLTYSGTVKGLERCLREGKPLARRPTLADRARTTTVVKFGYFPTGRRSPERAVPRGMTAEQVTAAIGPQITAMDEMIANCEGKFGRRTRLLDHPVLGPLTGREWRRFHWVHGNHHVKQILRLRERS